MSENNINSAAANEASPAGHGDHASHPKPMYDDVNIPVVVLLGILSAILTFVSIGFVQGLYYNWTEAMIRDDWNSRVLTQPEQTIVDQKEIRDGFQKTKDGKVYVSAEVAAREMIGSVSSQPQAGNDKSGKSPSKQPAENKETEKPEPPGPDISVKTPADPALNQAAKEPAQVAKEPAEIQAKESTPVKQDDAQTGK